MIVERVPHSGMIVISDIIDGYLVTRRYMEYSVREAKKLFKEEMKYVERAYTSDGASRSGSA